METFEWGPEYEVAINTVDDQHKHLVTLINTLGSELVSGELDFAGAQKLVAETAEYAKYHFDEEEKLMKEWMVDERHIRPHFDMHTKFLAYAASTFMDLREDNYTDSATQLMNFLVSWLGLHILTQDQVMARQIRAIQGGASPADSYEEYEKSSESQEPLVRILMKLVNAMFSRSHELQELKNSLEIKIAERTEALRKVNEHLKSLSFTDTLTGLPNRRHAMRHLATLWRVAEERDQALSCMMIDADHFKGVNDTYGHDAGDKLLCTVAHCLRDSVRTDDMVARMGGDEFLIVMPNTGLKDSFYLARKVHQQINQLNVEVSSGGFWKGSVSIGLATRHKSMESHNTLIKQADKALYKSKNAGKNCIRM